MELLGRSPSCFHAAANMKEALEEAGFVLLKEEEPFAVKRGGKYYLTRNDSSIIAFMVPEDASLGFRIAASHNDSPSFALKPNPIYAREGVTSINVEPYGGGIYYTWLDRPLSFAGRVFYKDEEGIKSTLVNIDEDILVIPSLAIHMNREVNKGYAFNTAKDMVPLWLDHAAEGDFATYLKEKGNVPGEILSHDLFLYVRENPRLVCGDSFLLSPRLDDLSSAYTSLLGFLDACKEKEAGFIPVFVSFDNEEVGSLTMQGANSDFLKNTLRRILLSLGYPTEQLMMAFASGVLLSVDNAHASHPNHMDKSDPTSKVFLNQGIVLKYNAEQRYTTSARSAAYVKSLAASLDQPIQEFTNRSDMRGGSTLGNISNAEVSLVCADIGIAQLAMHSSTELCGVKDIERMAVLLKAHYLDDTRI